MYNPAFEKDACGLAMVATLAASPATTSSSWR
jgi:glutamate synthase domain-containing protein 1